MHSQRSCLPLSSCTAPVLAGTQVHRQVLQAQQLPLLPRVLAQAAPLAHSWQTHVQQQRASCTAPSLQALLVCRRALLTLLWEALTQRARG